MKDIEEQFKLKPIARDKSTVGKRQQSIRVKQARASKDGKYKLIKKGILSKHGSLW
jgi:hypothetical protein